MGSEYVDGAQIRRLIGLGKYREAEAILLPKYSERRAADTEECDQVLSLLVSLYLVEGNQNLEKAEAYQLEREQLVPDPLTKWGTALFYLWTEQPQKAIDKVNEVRFVTREDDDEDSVLCDRHNFYSCLAIKGQALIQLGRVPESKAVIEELIHLVGRNPGRVQLRSGMNVTPLPFGDEMNLMQAAIEIPELRTCARQLLELVTPRIRDEEYRERGRRYLREIEGFEFR